MTERDPRDIGRIECAPGMCGGIPLVAGTRIPVSTVAENHAADTLRWYPELKQQDVDVCKAWWEERDYGVVATALDEISHAVDGCRTALYDANSEEIIAQLNRIRYVIRKAVMVKLPSKSEVVAT